MKHLNMKHLPHARSPVKSLCGLPSGGWRKDGQRHTLPELSDDATCLTCNAIAGRPSARDSRGIAPVGSFTRR